MMIKRKNALFAHFHGKLAKLKICHAKCRLFHLMAFNLKKKLNNKKKYQKQTKIPKKYFQKK